jgi:hypothetical protein
MSCAPSPRHELLELLQHREAVIADHAWRDRDPATHLDALKEVSGKISAWTATHQQQLDPRLRHFLTNASFAKASQYLADHPD